MTLIEDLTEETAQIARSQWTRRDGTVVPEVDSLKLANDAVDLDATFLYADLADSTELVIDSQNIAAEIMKAYLMGTTRIIRSLGGEIRSFDGDRVMGVFIGDNKNTAAAEAALKINYFFTKILKPAFAKIYTTRFPDKFNLKQTVGIDTGKIMVMRSGIRKNNDLVWVGKAPNVAAKLSSIRNGYAIYISSKVFHSLNKTSKYGGADQKLMWESTTWDDGVKYGTSSVYRSNWTWTP